VHLQLAGNLARAVTVQTQENALNAQEDPGRFVRLGFSAQSEKSRYGSLIAFGKEVHLPDQCNPEIPNVYLFMRGHIA
jgi:hypothetical protein